MYIFTYLPSFLIIVTVVTFKTVVTIVTVKTLVTLVTILAEVKVGTVGTEVSSHKICHKYFSFLKKFCHIFFGDLYFAQKLCGHNLISSAFFVTNILFLICFPPIFLLQNLVFFFCLKDLNWIFNLPLNSSRSPVVGRSVCRSVGLSYTFVKKWPLEYQVSEWVSEWVTKKIVLLKKNSD